MGMFDDYTQSIEAMKRASAKSGLVGVIPLLFDTSDMRVGDGPWHGWGMATDWGNNADQWMGSKEMDDHAIFLETNHGPTSLEIIHCFSGGGDWRNGIYWKNGQKVGGEFYGEETCNAHRGHNHWASTNTALAMVDPLPVVPPMSVLTDKDRQGIKFLQKVVLRMPVEYQTGYWKELTDKAGQDLLFHSVIDSKGFLAWTTLPGQTPQKARPSSRIKELQRAIFHFSAADQDGIWGPKTTDAWNLLRLCWKDK